jgi:hypothetical protein
LQYAAVAYMHTVKKTEGYYSIVHIINPEQRMFCGRTAPRRRGQADRLCPA